MFNIIQKKTGMQMTSKQHKAKIFAFSARSVAESNGTNFKRYYGYNTFKCVAVNPNAKELAALFNKEEVGQEPNYISEITTENGVTWPQVRIDLWLKSTSNIDMLVKLSYYLTRSPHYNGDKTKVHVIDEFGRTAWVTVEECQNHQIPVYKNGPANISNNYEPMYGREHEWLIGMLKSLLWIPAYQYVRDGQVVTNDPEKCKCKLDCINNYFKGDFSELRDAIMKHPENEIWALIGVRRAEDGNLYQVVFKEAMTSIRNTNYKNFIGKALKERKDSGAYTTVDFSEDKLKEYEVEETTFENNIQKAPQPQNIDNFFK